MGRVLASLAALLFILACSPAFAKRPAPTPTTHPAAASDEPLLVAAKAGDTEAVRAALKSGSEVNCVDKHMRTPLVYAARAGALPVVQLLLDQGADPNLEQNIYRTTPLQAALKERHNDVAMLLIEHHADVTAGANSIDAPLALAAGHGDLAMVKAFVAQGARADADTDCLGDCLDAAAACNHVDVLAYFFSVGFKASHRDALGATPLHFAVLAGATESVKFLVAQGADVNAVVVKEEMTLPEWVGRTPLDMVNATPHPETEKVLLDLGAKHGTKNQPR